MARVKKDANHYVEIYKDSAEQWRWRKVSIFNGDLVANSGESFYSKFNAKRAAKKANPETTIIVEK